MKSPNTFSIASLVLCVAAVPACTKAGAAASTVSPPTVAVVKATTGDVAQRLSVAAEFRPFQEIDVHAKVAGYVKSIPVDVGDRVRAGQLLAVLEVPELQDDLRENAAANRRAEEEVKRAQADLERSESAHEVAHVGATRLSGVLKAKPNLVAQQDIDEAMGRDRVAEAQVSTAKAAVAAAEQQLEMSRAAERKTQTLWSYTEIRAPFAGVITHRYADTGAMIQAGTSSQTQAMPIVRLSQNSTLRLIIPVPESAVSRIQLHKPVDLQVDALHKTFTGTIARFADRLDTDTRTMRVEVDVENRDLTLVPGMYATASVVLDAAQQVVVAPLEAIDRSPTSAQVFVVNPDHRVDVRRVTTGLENADRVEIKSGVAAGDLLVVGNRAQLKPGTIVMPKVTGGLAVDGEAQ